MTLTEENKILLLILLVAVAFWLFTRKSEQKKVDESTTITNTSNNFNDKTTKSEPFKHLNSFEHFDDSSTNISANDSSFLTQESVESASQSNDSFAQDNNIKPTYRPSSFRDGSRSTKSDELDKFFEGSYPTDATNNNGFAPMVDNSIGAAYASSNPEKLSDKDKFNPESLLPREKVSDWVDDPYEQVDVKSSTVSPATANIFRPIGISTVQSSKKIAYWDTRGIPKTPKMNISPFNNSSFNGDDNIKLDGLCS